MSEWKTTWSGERWCYCVGDWKLYKNGVEVKTDIPFNDGSAVSDGKHANTYGEYRIIEFNENYEEEDRWIEDGLHEAEWIATYDEWLSILTDDYGEKMKIYYAFNANDWRPGCCGGCI